MSQQKNEEYWENIAGTYDKNVGEKGDVRHEKVVNPVVFELLGNLKGKVVLDAGCGNGYMARRVAKTAQNVIGIDFTKEFIQKAKNKDNPKNLKFIVGNLEHLPFRQKIFDVIISNMVLMDVERIDIVANEFNKVLKLNGIVVISITHPCFENPPRTYSIFENNGVRIGRVIQKYFETGLIKDEKNRISNQPYQHYHYMISYYLNKFADNKFLLEKIVEPNGDAIDKNMGMNSDAPTFLIMKFKKIS